MGTIKTITITCWIIAALALIGLAIWFLTGTAFGFATRNWRVGWSVGMGWESLSGPFEIAGTYDIPANNISAIDIDWISGEVRIEPYDGNEIRITEYAQRELRSGENLRYEVNGNTLSIQNHEDRGIRHMPQKRLNVQMPRALSENLVSFAAKATSASVAVSGIKATDLTLNTISGAAQLSDITAQTLNTRTTSGAITVSAVSAHDIKLGSISGVIRISDSAAETLSSSSTSGAINLSGAYSRTDADSISGRITLENSAAQGTVTAKTSSGAIGITGAFDTAELRSTSGSISIASAITPSALKANTTSGSITVTVPEDGTVTVRHSSSSGRLTSDIPIIMQNHDAQFDLSSTSGSVRIHRIT